MIPPECLGPDVDRSKISPDARIGGASYLTGPRTAVGPGAVVRDSRLHDVLVEAGATVVDSIVLSEGPVATHRCDAAGRTVVGGASPTTLGRAARVEGCTLRNTAVGAGSRVRDTWASDCTLGEGNTIHSAKLTLVGADRRVTIAGPTEVSEAWLGHGTTVDQSGYFEGVFSNRFLRLRYDASKGRLRVIGSIDLPHVSRYGANTINSTNSGKLLPQPEGVLRELGAHGGLWQDRLLSHEPIELGPCCWVAPWTKVVGQSPAAHATDEDLVADPLATYVMPFAVAGWEGPLTRGLVMPGELSVGFGPKQRRGAWAFTYAPGAVIAMVARLRAALEDERKAVADTIVEEALDTALAITQAMAARYEVDLAVPPAGQPKGGWPAWIATTFALLVAHREPGLWQFEGGRPIAWRRDNGRWVHPAMAGLLALAPDALANQVDEEDLMKLPTPAVEASVALPAGAVPGTGGPPQIDPAAAVSPEAHIGPGCRIGPGTTIESGAVLWNAVLERCRVGRGSRIERSVLTETQIGDDTTVRSSQVERSRLAGASTVDAARLRDVELAPRATVSALANLENVSTRHGVILGCRTEHSRIETHLMSMHVAGRCSHLEALPTPVCLEGRTVLVPAVPMLGGGSRIEGTAEAPVRIECCFVGSNAVVERGAEIGFGCFLLGRIEAGAKLPPFTATSGAGPWGDQIGGVLASLASTILTHFLNWTYQAVGPERADAVAVMVEQAIARGLEMIHAELARRGGGSTQGEPPRVCAVARPPALTPDPSPKGRGEMSPTAAVSARAVASAHATALARYTEAQLLAGVANYQRALASGAWRMESRGGRLWFSAERGEWLAREGAAFWRPR